MSEIPINSVRLADRIDRSRWYVAAMKAAGYKFTHGSRTLLTDALRWLRNNPEFRSTFYHEAAASKGHKRPPRPQLVGADTGDGPTHFHD
jgi:hypothetical protein